MSGNAFFLVTSAMAVLMTSSETNGGCMIIIVHFHRARSLATKADISSAHQRHSSGMTA